MWKFIIAGLALAMPAMAEPTKGYYTYDAMGCMILRECTEGVVEIHTILDVSSNYENTDLRNTSLMESFTPHSLEFNNMMMSFKQIGVKVFLADQKYFPPGHRGVYHTVSNNFFLNKSYMGRPSTLMSVMRHEGWHAAQDCMAGSIKNSMIAIIMPEEDVPDLWREMAERTYPKSAVPWEAEATWAGKTEGMTQKALESCAAGNMWETYKPTPLTEQWLREEGYMK